ncbi:MAG: AsmA-like C-terminal region-containing protein, partial [Rhodospirillales bacterium]|nr:AsmA-like C-terminal region-containing protein [Rhodospirillales bacterium]
GAERWSRDPIDLSGMATFNATLNARAQSMTYRHYRVENADVAITLLDGVLKVERLTGAVFDGQLDGAAIINSMGSRGLNGRLSATNINIAKATLAATGETVAVGKANIVTDVTAQGNSVFGIISTLNGKGSFDLRGVDVKSSDKAGSLLSGPLALIGGLYQFTNALGGQKGSGLSDVSGSYVIANGVARSDDLKIVSVAGNGVAKGAVDFPNWLVDVKGEVQTAKNPIMALLAKKVKIPDVVPFTVIGQLDAPKVTIHTAQKQAAPTPQDQPATQPPPEEPKKKVRPEDIFKNLLLKGLGR